MSLISLTNLLKVYIRENEFNSKTTFALGSPSLHIYKKIETL